MAVLWIPPSMRDLTGGKEKVLVPGRNVREALANLEALHPGVWDRLIRDGELSPHVSVVVDGQASTMGARHPLRDESDVRFLPMIAGGQEMRRFNR